MAHPQADRNLLFGVLALQLDFLRRDALIAAMHAWVLEKTKPLGQILREQGALSPERQALLEALVAEHLRQHANDAHKSLAAMSSLGAAGNELKRIADPDVQDSLSHVSTAQPATDEAPDATRIKSSETRPPAGLRFRILRPHAKGGLGEVFVAQDEELHREVALKEIQCRHADNPASRSRFVLEAEITGGLEHPGIVPVYGLGQYADGRPYYAMRFIRGESLKEAIERFHQGDGPRGEPSGRSLALRKLLGRFLDVCNAIAYAHSRGVLHRDLKPANVMLGRYGETLVVDWGLAKPLGCTEDSGAEEAPLQPSSASGTAETLPGSAVGTPQFMSPEQAAGRLDRLGRASDVYGLGATLYALLTGKPPVEGSEVPEVLRKVRLGEVVPPRRHNRAIPAPLEAICLKAMALRPEDRYPSPRELADDVEHWLADEPVTAYRERWSERVGRWTRRHRAKVTAAVAALLVAVLTLTTATGLLLAANERERRAKDQAGERFRLAREAVDQFLTQVSNSPDMKARGVEKLRARLLNQAIEFYARLVTEEEGKGPEVQAERARMIHSLAQLKGDLGRLDQAEQSYQESIHIWKDLVARHAEAADYQAGLATTLCSLGSLYTAGWRNDLGEQRYDEALAIQRKLVAEHPNVPEYRAGVANTLHELGWLYNDTGREAQAEAAYREALGIRRELVADMPESTDYRVGLARSLHRVGVLYRSTGRSRAAEQMYEEALVLKRKLVAEHPDDPDRQRDLTATLSNLADLYRDGRRDDLARSILEEALGVYRRLAAEHTEVNADQGNLISACNHLGLLYNDRGQKELAEQLCQEGLAAFRKLAARDPEAFGCLNDLVVLLITLGKLEEPCQLLRQAVASSREKLGREHPVTLIRQNQLAWLLEKAGRAPEAEALYRETLASQRRVLGPGHKETVLTQINLAVLLANQGQRDRAEALVRELPEGRRAEGPDPPQMRFDGEWVGKWKNSSGEAGAERLRLEESADGTITGVWSWWSQRMPVRGERLGKSSFVIRGNTTNRVYGGIVLVEGGKLRLVYSAWIYFGRSEFSQSR